MVMSVTKAVTQRPGSVRMVVPVVVSYFAAGGAAVQHQLLRY